MLQNIMQQKTTKKKFLGMLFMGLIAVPLFAKNILAKIIFRDNTGLSSVLVTEDDISGSNTGDENRASVQFTNLDSFTTAISRRGRSEKAKTMTTYEISADVSGSASVTVKKASYTNLPATLTDIDTITLTTAQKDTGAIAVTLAAGDYLIFGLASCSGITELRVEIY